MLQRQFLDEHGTTLAGLMANYTIDPEHFLHDVHQVPLDGLEPDPRLADQLRRLPGRCFVFTNGAREYAGRVLDRLKDSKAAASAAAASPVAAAPAGTAFADRLPVKFRAGTVYAVSAEDHYLRVHTSLGETMVLMRLADAVRELASIEGLQTHRSWWVAKQGLADASRGDGKVTLTLKSGVEAPVSRTYQKAVKDAGWL